MLKRTIRGVKFDEDPGVQRWASPPRVAHFLDIGSSIHDNFGITWVTLFAIYVERLIAHQIDGPTVPIPITRGLVGPSAPSLLITILGDCIILKNWAQKTQKKGQSTNPHLAWVAYGIRKRRVHRPHSNKRTPIETEPPTVKKLNACSIRYTYRTTWLYIAE
jgi:hypothetical protein